MAEEVAISFLGILAERMVDPVLRQFSYLIFYNSNIENLVKELKRLQAARDGVKRQVLTATQNLETTDPVMQFWLAGVDEIERKASLVMERKSKFEEMCLNLGCLNVKQRYSLSRKARKIIIGIEKLKSDGDKYAKLTHSASPPGIVADNALFPELATWIGNSQSMPNSKGSDFRKSIVEQIMEALKDDGIRMIGICGIGGVGKTTMANEVCKIAKAQGLFQEFAMTSVSQNQDLHKIQKELAGMLGLTLNDNDTIFLRAPRLGARLSNKKRIIVILDDVWEELPLQQVGIPTSCVGCKVICTSRSKDVLRDMGTHKFFDVPFLSNTESWDLFQANVGNIYDTTDRYATAKKIVKKCGGLPIAIITLAKALKDKEKYVWDNALHHLEDYTGEKIHGMAEHVYKCIELSYQFLKDSRAKTLLVLCCLFPEDAHIQVEILVRFIKFPGLEETKDGVRTLVGDLISNNLLVAGRDDNLVKVHDIVREVCLSIEGLNKLEGNLEPSIKMAKRSIKHRKHAFYEEAGSQAFKQVMSALGDNHTCKIGIVSEMCTKKGTFQERVFFDEVTKKVQEENLFDDVAMIVVSSETPDLLKMQGDLAKMLGLAYFKELTSIDKRAKQLRARLTEGRKTLVIIRNCLWEKVGIPVGGEHNKGSCKVMLVWTSLSSLADGIEKIVRFEEAWVLFGQHTSFQEEVTHIAKLVVKECCFCLFVIWDLELLRLTSSTWWL